MIKFTAELEDIGFTAERKAGEWVVKLYETEQAKRDFKREKELTAELTLDDREMGALLNLAAAGDDAEECSMMYDVIEDKLASLPIELRPVP